MNSNGIDLTQKFITTIKGKDNHFNFKTYSLIIEDLDHDGTKEVLFSIIAGFGVFPRSIFCYNTIKDTVLKSPFLGNYTLINEVIDINGDKSPEIILNTYSSSNFYDSSKRYLSDYSSWLIVLGNDLNLLFPPFEFKSKFSGINVYTFNSESKVNLLALLNIREKADLSEGLYLFNDKGELLNKKVLNRGDYQLIREKDKNLFLLFNTKTGKINYIDSTLNFIKSDSLPVYSNTYIESEDIDFDIEKERLLIDTYSNFVIITRNDFSNPVYIHFADYSDKSIKFSKIRLGKSQLQLFFQKGKNWYKYEYHKNPYYNLRYLVSFGIFLSVLIFVFLIINFIFIGNRKGRKRPPVNYTVSLTQALTPVLRTNITLPVRAFTPL